MLPLTRARGNQVYIKLYSAKRKFLRKSNYYKVRLSRYIFKIQRNVLFSILFLIKFFLCLVMSIYLSPLLFCNIFSDMFMVGIFQKRSNRFNLTEKFWWLPGWAQGTADSSCTLMSPMRDTYFILYIIKNYEQLFAYGCYTRQILLLNFKNKLRGNSSTFITIESALQIDLKMKTIEFVRFLGTKSCNIQCSQDSICWEGRLMTPVLNHFLLEVQSVSYEARMEYYSM